MDNKEEEIACSCLDNIINWFKRNTGKMGVILSIMGIASSVLIGLKYIVAGAVVIGITNLNILIGSISFERLQSEYDKVNGEIESLKMENRRLTMFSFPHSVTSEATSLDIPRDHFNSIYYGNIRASITTDPQNYGTDSPT